MTDQLVRLVPWSDDDLDLLRRVNTPEMKKHLGGPETEEKVLARHQRYLALPNGRMFRVALAGTGEPVGTIGHWDREWQGEQVYETGWSVLPEFQGRGIAVAAARALIEAARADGRHRWLHAYPGWTTCRRTRSAARRGSSWSGRTTSSTRRAASCAATTGATTCGNSDRPVPAKNLGRISPWM
ncbi:GNAT family N-acetyltransferase [Catellatospora coxensis]